MMKVTGGAKRRAAVLLAGVALAAISVPASAQVAAPAVRQSVDANGVDLLTGTFNMSTTEISIGPADNGLSFTRYWTGSGWRDSGLTTLTGSTSAPVVSIGGASESFTLSDGSYASTEGGGATLTESNGYYTYTASDGTIVQFRPPNGTSYNRFGSNLGWVSSVTAPNGVVNTFNYAAQGYYTGCSYIPACTFGSAARLASVTSSLGYELRFRYEQNETTPQAINDPAPWTNMVGVSTINRAVSTSQQLSSISYEGSYTGPVTSITDAAGRTTAYGYTSGKLTSVRRPGSSVDDVVIGYGSDGKVSTITRAGQTWNYTFDLINSGSVMQTQVTDPLFHTRTVYSDTSNSRVGADVNENGWKTRFDYEPNDQARLQTVTYPEGNQTIYGYDVRGNVTSTTSRAKAGSGLGDLVTSATYPETCTVAATCNKPITTTDASGGVTNYYYEPHGGPSYVEGPVVGGVRPRTSYGYVAVGAWLKDASGNTYYNSSQPVVLLTEVSSCRTANTCAGTVDETKTSYSYYGGPSTTNLHLYKVTVAAGDGSLSSETSYGYDDVRNVTSVTDPNGNTTALGYNEARQQTATVSPDPDGAGPKRPRILLTHYMADGNPDSVTQGTVNVDGSNFQALQYQFIGYDPYGRKTVERVNPVSNTAPTAAASLTQYGYDAVGRVECVAQRMVPSTYDSLPGACTQTSGAPDRITRTEYEWAGGIWRVSSGVGTGLARYDATYLHNTNSQTTQVTDGKGNTTGYQYDGHSRLVRTCFNATAASCGSDFVQLAYGTSGTGNGRVISRSLRGHPTNLVTGYIYDTLGRVTRIDYPGSGFTDQDVTLTYDLLGRLTSAADDGTHSATFDYDALGRVTRQGDSLASRYMQYDPGGRRTKLTWQQDGLYVTYAYDATGAMTAIRENGAGVLASFGYDDLGRRTSLTRGNGVTTAYGYDSVSRLTDQDISFPNASNNQSIDFGYNAAGQITSRAASNDAYAWTQHYNVSRPYATNALNQYSTIGSGSTQLTPSYDVKGNLASAGGPTFSYNTKNQLSFTTDGGKQFYNDPLGRLDMVADVNGTAITGFQYDGSEIVTELALGGAILRRYVRGPGTDEPIVWYEGAGTADKRYLVADERGSVIAVTNTSGTPIAINAYDEYGVPASTNLGRFQYTGQAWIPELRMYDYKARTYSPTLGRFMQTDPIGYQDGVNWYNYVGGDPVNMTDPSGLAVGTLCPPDPTSIVVCGHTPKSEDDHFTNYFYGWSGGDYYGGSPGQSAAPTPPTAAGLGQQDKQPGYCKSPVYRALGEFADGMGKVETAADTAFVGAALAKLPNAAAVAASVGAGAGLIQGASHALQGVLGNREKFRDSVTDVVGAVLPDPWVPKSLQSERGNFVAGKLFGAGMSKLPSGPGCGNEK